MNKDRKYFSIYLDAGTASRVERVAQYFNTSRNREIQTLIEEGLEVWESRIEQMEDIARERENRVHKSV